MNGFDHALYVKHRNHQQLNQADFSNRSQHRNVFGIWEDLSMDFITTSLPPSSGYTIVLVIVDRLSKGAHFVGLRHPFTAFPVAKSFFETVVKLHGVPRTIVYQIVTRYF